MNSSNSAAPPARTWLFLALLTYVALWFLYPQEYIASDPGAYSTRAYAISQHLGFGSGGIFDQRLGATVPVGILYSIFGVNIFTTNLWPLLAALIVMTTVWLSLPDDKSKIVGAVLCLTSIPLLQSSIALYPDIIATAFMAASSLILFKRRQLLANRVSWRLIPSTAAGLLFLAFLAKESAYWTLPLWLMALFSDLQSEDKNLLLRRFYLPALIAGMLLGTMYLFFCHIVWGDALSHFHSIQALTGQHLWSWDKATHGELIKRLTTAPADLFLSQYGAGALLLAILGIVIAPPSIKPWIYYTVFCLFFFWFGSTSFSRYEPMPLVDRMTLPLLPGFYILAAYTASRLTIASDQAKSINPLLAVLLVLGFSGVPFAQYVQSWRGVELSEATAMSAVKNDVKRHPDKTYLLLCSDSRSQNSLSFYFGYRYPENLRVIFAGDLTDELTHSDAAYIFTDRQRSAFLKAAYGQQNFDAQIDALGLTPLYRSGSVELIKTIQQDLLKKLIHEDLKAN